MEKPLYRIVLAEAWQATWRQKRLWVWGLIAGLLGNAGEYQFILTATDRIAGREAISAGTRGLLVAPPLTGQTAAGFWRAFSSDPAATLGILLIGFAVVGLAAFFIWLTMVSVAAMVSGAAAVAAGEPAPSLADGVATGRRHFGSVLVLYVFGRLLQWFLLTLLVLFGVLSVYDFLLGFPIFLVGFLVLVPALFAVSFVVRYAIMAVVLKGRGLLEAMESGMALFGKHWLITVELAFLLFVVNLFVGLALVVLIGLFVVPMLLAAVAVWQLGFFGSAFSLVGLAVALFLLFLFVLGAALGTFQWTAWTNLFLKLQVRGPASKLVRLLTRLVPNTPVRLTRPS